MLTVGGLKNVLLQESSQLAASQRIASLEAHLESEAFAAAGLRDELKALRTEMAAQRTAWDAQSAE